MAGPSDDWRLSGQARYLTGVELSWKRYSRLSDTWDHDHCEFCWSKFSAAPEDLHEGYTTSDSAHWICENCYADFKGMFKWEIRGCS